MLISGELKIVISFFFFKDSDKYPAVVESAGCGACSHKSRCGVVCCQATFWIPPRRQSGRRTLS